MITIYQLLRGNKLLEKVGKNSMDSFIELTGGTLYPWMVSRNLITGGEYWGTNVRYCGWGQTSINLTTQPPRAWKINIITYYLYTWDKWMGRRVGSEIEFHWWRGVLDTTLCDQVWHRLVTGQWFFSGTPLSDWLSNWPPRYNWDIVESGVKHHNPEDMKM